MNIIKQYTALKNTFVKVNKITFRQDDNDGTITTHYTISNVTILLSELSKDFDVNIIQIELKEDVLFDEDWDLNVTTITHLDEGYIYNGLGYLQDEEFFRRPDTDLYSISLDDIILDNSYISISDLYILMDEGAMVESSK